MGFLSAKIQYVSNVKTAKKVLLCFGKLTHFNYCKTHTGNTALVGFDIKTLYLFSLLNPAENLMSGARMDRQHQLNWPQTKATELLSSTDWSGGRP